MALQAESLAGSYSPQVVAAAFVKQYYEVVRYTREDAYKFYNDSSILGRPDSDGNMISVKTIDDIKTQLLSTHLSHCLIEVESVDSQPSHVDGNGYFVLNDMFKFARRSTEAKEVVANHDNESTQSTTSPAEPEAASIKENTVPNIPAAENIMPVHDEVISPSTKVVSEVKNVAVVEKCVEAVPSAKAVSEVKNAAAVETCVKVDNKDIEKIPEAAPAPPSAEKEVPKKTYASIVKTMRESIPPAPAAKPKPNPKPKAAQNVEKSFLPTKPAHAATTAPPSDNNVSKNKSSDEPGYSVFIKNLPFEATVEMVAEEFSKFGAIKPGGIQVKKYLTDRFCFGFVEFESKHSMEAAIEAYTVYFGSWESYVEEKRTKTRVVDGVITHGDDDGNGGGGRFQSGRDGYHGDSYRGHAGYRNNGYYHDGNNMRNDFRNQSEYSGRGRGPQGNGYHQNRNGYHQNGNGYPQNGNGGHQQRGPNNNGNGNGNGKAERPNNNGDGNGNGMSQPRA